MKISEVMTTNVETVFPTRQGAESAFDNCMGWTGMLAALKVWVEHGINLREGFYA